MRRILKKIRRARDDKQSNIPLVILTGKNSGKKEKRKAPEKLNGQFKVVPGTF
jgi:hypothetical protein